MNRTDALARLANAPSGHLATVRPGGRPHVVVITFAVTAAQIVTAIDQKPKTTTRLQRLTNIENRPDVSFLVDHYEDDWSRLWWVRVDGRARIVDDADERNSAIAILQEKYPQYADSPPRGPVIGIDIATITGWSSFD